MRISLIKCNLCQVEEDKPRGMLPDNWFSYAVSRQPLDLCPDCKGLIKKALNAN